jgi:hypothetical protein
MARKEETLVALRLWLRVAIAGKIMDESLRGKEAFYCL